MLRVALYVLCAFSCSLELFAETTDKPVPTVNPNPPEPEKTTTKSVPPTTKTTTTTTTTKSTTTTQPPSTTTTTAPIPNNEVPGKPVHSNIELRDPLANSSLCFKAEFNFEFDVHYNSNDSVSEKVIYLPKLNEVTRVPGCAKAKNLTVPLEWRWNDLTWSANLTFAADNQTYNLTGADALFPNDIEFFPENANTC